MRHMQDGKVPPGTHRLAERPSWNWHLDETLQQQHLGL